MANEFIARKGFISLTNAQITGSLSVTGDVSASAFSGSFIGDGSQLTGIEGFPFTGSAGITGSLTVVGPVNATTFTGDGSQLTGIEGFPYTGSAGITGSLIVDGNVEATSFTGSLQGTSTSSSYVQLVDVDGFTAYSSSVNTAIGNVLNATTPLTATVNTTNTPLTLTSQSIVVADSTNGNLTINLPDLNTIVGTPNQKPIVVYKNDYSQNVIYVNPSGSQLVNGSTQDIIVSIQLAVIYNPTSAGWVTEGTSAQSLAELELFFVPKTETGSLSVATASYVEYTNVVNKPTLVSGSSQISFSGITGKPTLVSGSSQISFSGITNKPTLVSGSSQISFTGIVNKPTGLLSSSVQVKGYNVFATTGSNQFNGSQAITGSLTVTGQVIAQTLNVQQVTSSIVFSSGSNRFGNSLSNTQQFTGSVSVTGSLIATSGLQVTANNNALGTNNTLRFTDTDTATEANQQIGKIEFFSSDVSTPGAGVKAYIGAFAADTTPDAYIAFATQDGSGTPNPVERVRISSEGNVGIGTTSPNSPLEVQADSGGTGIRIKARATANSGTLRFFNNASDTQLAKVESSDNSFEIGSLNNVYAAFLTNSSERMRITAGGNVGIGTTSPGKILEAAKAEANNQIILTESSDSGDDTALFYARRSRGTSLASPTATQALNNMGGLAMGGFNGTSYAIGAKIKAITNQNWTTSAQGTNLIFETTSDNSTTVTERMRITAGGEILMGTTSDLGSYTLQVASSTTAAAVLSIQNTSASGYSGAHLQSSGGSIMGHFGYANASTGVALQDVVYFGSIASKAVVFTTNDTEKMRITSGGNVGIGTNNPSQLLEVVGGEIKAGRVDTTNEGGQVSFGRASDNATGWYIDVFGNTSTPSLRFVDVSNSAVRMTITSGGNVLIGTTSDNGARLQVNSASTLLTTLAGEGNTTTSIYGVNIVTSSSTPVTIDINTGRSNALFQISIDAMSYDVGLTHWVTAIGRGYLFPSGFGISTSIISNSGLSASISYVSNSVVRVTITDSVSSSSKSGVCRITVTAKSP